MDTMTKSPGEAAGIASTVEAQTDLMRTMARSIADEPNCEIKPLGIGLIASALGIIGQAVSRLEEAQARADQAYAEGLRHRDDAVRSAREQTEGGFVTIDLADDWLVVDEGQELLLPLKSREDRIAVAAILRTAQQFRRRIRISIEGAVDG